MYVKRTFHTYWQALDCKLHHVKHNSFKHSPKQGQCVLVGHFGVLQNPKYDGPGAGHEPLISTWGDIWMSMCPQKGPRFDKRRPRNPKWLQTWARWHQKAPWNHAKTRQRGNSKFTLTPTLLGFAQNKMLWEIRASTCRCKNWTLKPKIPKTLNP